MDVFCIFRVIEYFQPRYFNRRLRSAVYHRNFARPLNARDRASEQSNEFLAAQREASFLEKLPIAKRKTVRDTELI